MQKAACAAKIPLFNALSIGVQNAIMTDLKTREHNTDKDKDEDIDSDNEDKECTEDEENEEEEDDANSERKSIGATILGVFNNHESLEVTDKFLLNASFSSLLGKHHGVRDITCFNIVSLTIESGRVTAKVRTEHDTLVEIRSSVHNFSDMLSQELEEYSNWSARQHNKTDQLLANKISYHQFIAEISGPSIGGKAPRAQDLVETRIIKCWCCSREIKYGVVAMAQKKDSPSTPILRPRKRSLSPSAEMQDRAKLPKLEAPRSAAEQGQS